MLLNEMRMLCESNALPFLFLVLIKEMGGVPRSSNRRCFAIKLFRNIYKKTLVLESFLNNVSGFVKIRLHHRVFLVNIMNSLEHLF